MKLTKAQRLFIAAGQVQNELMLQKAYHAPWDDGREESGKHIKEYKARRKRLIREALWAYEEELIRAFYDGVSSVRKESDDSPMVIEEDGQNIII